MNLDSIKNKLLTLSKNKNSLVDIDIGYDENLKIYPKSIQVVNDNLFYLGKISIDKVLFITVLSEDKNISDFIGETIFTNGKGYILKCPLNTHNRKILQCYFDFLSPELIGLANSFGFGDRLGLANPGHIRAVNNSNFKPVLAQQSVRELSRTKRSPEEVMDAAVWAVFQEGYKGGFGADADHLKSTEDIDLILNAGFTMFTFDSGDYVRNDADRMDFNELEKRAEKLDWSSLNDSFSNLVESYSKLDIKLDDVLHIRPEFAQVLKALVKYGGAIAHIKRLNEHLTIKYSDCIYEIEISVDETEAVTTPFEHFFIVSELKRLGIEIISLAPKFIGAFEKGIDYKGNISEFKKEYLKHVLISQYFGTYKLSIHSGSDKFKVYEGISSIDKGFVHIKTAGTSYLEALKVIASANPKLFREILDFAGDEYENEKETYHISADLEKVKSSNSYSDSELMKLFTDNNARQVLHVTYGKVLTAVDDKGRYRFKDNIYRCLSENEGIHYDFLIKHFNKHLQPFKI